MDKTTRNNEKKWDELVRSDVPCSRPNLKLTPKMAKNNLNKARILGDLRNKKVLCLASGGGQQSIGFTLLGAKVTVVDFSSEQLEKDKIVSKKFTLPIRTIKADMRDLSMFEDAEFDVIYQPYSINYISEINKVFDEVARIIKPNGIYYLMFHNPFVHGLWKDGCWGGKWNKKELWKGKGYPLWQPYKDRYAVKTSDPNWNFFDNKGKKVKIKSPQEFKHTLSTILNGLIQRGFKILKFDEHKGTHYNSSPGTWDHYISCAPPWLYVWAKKETLYVK
ncbi:MAG: class I SAM-dependent methyltransferase [Patescibacteria group bacterium]